MIYCGECGTMFRKKSGENNIFWVCRTRDHDSAECPTPQVAEKVLMNAFVNLYNRLVYLKTIVQVQVVVETILQIAMVKNVML